MIEDSPARQRALDPTHSFIVQAPAGSGKTELLTQRVLVLLSLVNEPEEILALTFTRKAAQEMRSRIIQALITAHTRPEPQAAYAKTTYRLAKAALERNQLNNWELIANPNRLRIMTIDALCSSLTRQLPIVSRFGAQPEVAQNANPLYQLAVESLLGTLDSAEPWCQALTQVLAHCDNRWGSVQGLLVSMLVSRDQWLSWVMAAQPDIVAIKKQLEQSLAHISQEACDALFQVLPEDIQQSWVYLIRYAAAQLREQGIPSAILACIDLIELPKDVSTKYKGALWEGLCTVILTTEDTLRKQVNKNTGFPVGDLPQKNAKAQMMRLLAFFENTPSAVEALIAIRRAPPVEYSSIQWNFIEALLIILPVLVAHLYLIFKQKSQVDFIEVSLGALHALGEEDEPSDLALLLDYQINHLLVDELQDTSYSQYKLFSKLLSGWEENSGKSFFLVGDPMQSIYRFRGAEVGLFLKMKKGIAGIMPEVLQLSTNFRSAPQVVDWVNRVFSYILPQKEEVALGKVSYTPAVSHQVNHTGQVNNISGVFIHPVLDQDEAEKVVEIIIAAKNSTPDASIAVLVRARKHAEAILFMLTQARIPFQAVEMANLSMRQTIIDLFSLTRALLYLEDRVAWLSILRAPWCGLLLEDLHSLVSRYPERIIWDILQNIQDCKLTLTENGYTRIQRIVPILDLYLKKRRRATLSQWIKGAWLALGGEALGAQAQAEAKMYFELLDQLDEGSDLLDYRLLAENLENLYLQSDRDLSANVHVMTIHKAKGLEFDVVILPGLNRVASKEIGGLILSVERPTETGVDWLLAPKRAQHQTDDALYQYVYQLNQEKMFYESQRLLYVAATRAKTQLHWVAVCPPDLKPPSRYSFLGMLWNNLHDEIVLKWQVKEGAGVEIGEVDMLNQSQYRLPIACVLPEIRVETGDGESKNLNRPERSMGFLRHVGTFVHRLLKECAQIPEADRAVFLSKLNYKVGLLRLGVSPEEMQEAESWVRKAVYNIIQSKHIQWILSSEHINAENEWALVYVKNQAPVTRIIDRTFVEMGQTAEIRWVIDYKITVDAPEPNKYSAQLEEYCSIMKKIDNRPVRYGLYFPIQDSWQPGVN